jgi:hypothetical protein
VMPKPRLYSELASRATWPNSWPDGSDPEGNLFTDPAFDLEFSGQTGGWYFGKTAGVSGQGVSGSYEVTIGNAAHLRRLTKRLDRGQMID